MTGGALDSHEELPGPIYLQGDHGGIAYRNFWYPGRVKKGIDLSRNKFSLGGEMPHAKFAKSAKSDSRFGPTVSRTN